MVVHIIPVLLHISIPLVSYLLLWAFYRFILHPDYRWHQSGNVCHENAMGFSVIGAFILWAISEILINKLIVIQL